MNTTRVSLGDLIATVYDEFVALYGDEELASVATAALINDMLSDTRVEETSPPSAEHAAA